MTIISRSRASESRDSKGMVRPFVKIRGTDCTYTEADSSERARFGSHRSCIATRPADLKRPADGSKPHYFSCSKLIVISHSVKD